MCSSTQAIILGKTNINIYTSRNVCKPQQDAFRIRLALAVIKLKQGCLFIKLLQTCGYQVVKKLIACDFKVAKLNSLLT